MSLFVLWYALVMVTVVTAVTFILPALVRPTLPLGVSVPHDRVEMPVVRAAIRQYRRVVVAAWAVGVALTLVLFPSFPATASIVPLLLTLAIAMLGYTLSRRPILRAKEEGRWYEDVPVRIRAEITANSAPARPPLVWLTVAVVILLVAIAVGVEAYPTIADPTPLHWNATGQADAYAPKSVWSVFGTVLIGLGVVALLFACSFLVRLAPLRAVVGDTPVESLRRTRLRHRLLTSLLGQLAVVVAVQIGWLAAAGWFAPDGSETIMAGVIVLILLVLVVLVTFAVRYRHAVASWSAPSRGGRSDAPDDDRFWKGGLVYVNRDDPSVFVEKRFGVGWTVNFGSTGGKAFGIVLALVIVGGAVTAIVTSIAGYPS